MPLLFVFVAPKLQFCFIIHSKNHFPRGICIIILSVVKIIHYNIQEVKFWINEFKVFGSRSFKNWSDGQQCWKLSFAIKIPKEPFFKGITNKLRWHWGDKTALGTVWIEWKQGKGKDITIWCKLKIEIMFYIIYQLYNLHYLWSWLLVHCAWFRMTTLNLSSPSYQIDSFNNFGLYYFYYLKNMCFIFSDMDHIHVLIISKLHQSSLDLYAFVYKQEKSNLYIAPLLN